MLKKQIVWPLTLLLFSFSFYLYFYGHIFFHPNSLLLFDQGDAMKNYYTYAYQIKYGNALLDFEGMNYPYGEQMVYTDGQPLLTALIGSIPFLSPISIGILNLLVLCSFVFSPLIFFRVFKKLGLNDMASFCGGLSIVFLSPQTERIAGHYSLSYIILYALFFLYLLNYLERPSLKKVIPPSVLTFAAYFLHPYIGFTFTFFAFICLLLFVILEKPLVKRFVLLLHVIGIAVIPVVLFRLILMFADDHGYRYAEPHFEETYQTNIESVFVPRIGPFRHFLSQVIKVYAQHWGSCAYVGIASILFYLVFFICLPIKKLKLKLPPHFFPILIPALLLLLFAMGLHLRMGESFSHLLGPIKQFRNISRFAWIFYYAFVVMGFALSYKLLYRSKPIFFYSAYLMILALFITEASPYHFEIYNLAGHKKNSFQYQYLNQNEKDLVQFLRKGHYKAILPLPMTHVGSEFYQRYLSPSSFERGMLLSYHSGLPLIGINASRTALNETRQTITLLCPFIRKSWLEKLPSDTRFAVVAENDLALDEKQFLKKCALVWRNESVSLYEITAGSWLQTGYEKLTPMQNKPGSSLSTDSSWFNVEMKVHTYSTDSFSDGKQFFHSINILVPGLQLEPGDYVLSMRFYETENSHKINTNVYLETETAGTKTYTRLGNMREQSGIFDDFIVFEAPFTIERNAHCTRITVDDRDKDHRLNATHFLIRKANSNVLLFGAHGSVVSVNGYPVH